MNKIIFYIKKESLTAFMKGQKTADQLQEEAADNQHYCQAYRNFEPVGDFDRQRDELGRGGT